MDFLKEPNIHLLILVHVYLHTPLELGKLYTFQSCIIPVLSLIHLLYNQLFTSSLYFIPTTSGYGLEAPCCSTVRKLMISTPRFFALCMVGDRTSLIVINIFKHFGARSRIWLHFESLSTTITEISAVKTNTVLVRASPKTHSWIILKP